MTSQRREYASEVAAARAYAEVRFTDLEFRNHWLGLTEESRNLRAQQLLAFGELIGSLTRTLAGWRILDVGCGDGRWLRSFLEYDAKPEDVMGVDVSDARFASSASSPAVAVTITATLCGRAPDGRGRGPVSKALRLAI